MVEWVYRRAEQAKRVSEVRVATDDERIFKAVEAFGGKAVMTSPDHPSGTDRVAEAVRGIECDLVVNVQGDEPLMPPGNIDLAIGAFLDDPAIQVSTLKIRVTDPGEVSDPHIAKVVTDRRGFALYFSRAPIPFDRDRWGEMLKGRMAAREDLDAVAVYKHIGLYVYTKAFLARYPELEMSPLEKAECLEQLRILHHGIPLKVVETRENSIGVDRPGDLDKIERILNQQK